MISAGRGGCHVRGRVDVFPDVFPLFRICILVAVGTLRRTHESCRCVIMPVTILIPGCISLCMSLFASLFASLSHTDDRMHPIDGRVAGAVERVAQMAGRRPLLPAEGGKAPDLEAVKGQITFTDVSFTYGSSSSSSGSSSNIDGDTRGRKAEGTVLSSLSLSVKPGERVGIVGRSGCGKSTALRLLSRLYDPSRGTITLDGNDLKDLDPRWLRAAVGVVPQEPALFSGSVFDNIAMGRPPPYLFGREEPTEEEVLAAARLAGIPTPPRSTAVAAAAAAAADDDDNGFVGNGDGGGYAGDSAYAITGNRVEEKASNLTVWTPVGEGGQQLSGGEKQRVAIARLALANPRVALLDEASSALDAGSERDIERKLEDVIGGRTTLVVSHKLSAMLMACDRVVVLDEGAVVEEGSPRELLATEGSYLQAMRIEDRTRSR